MNRELLKKVIADQKEYRLPKNVFERTQSEILNKHSHDPNIIILSGIRRSGKSTILKILQSTMTESDYYLNFDDERLVQFSLEDFQMLQETFIELFGKQQTFYFDEIQNIVGWETFIRRLHDQNNKIFITGSNANLLSRELGTRLTGRFIPIEVYPLSFKELVSYELPEIPKKTLLSTTDIGMLLRAFSRYLIMGGIPDYVKYESLDYLKSLYEGIIYRDVISRYGITEEKALKELVYYFASNIGKEFSYNNLSKLLNLGSSHTISSYCHYLENSYLCFFLTRYSPSLQSQMHYNKKCYMIDPAIIRLIGFRTSEDRGRIIENIVFLHLKMRGEEIYFHKSKKECDFLLRKGNKIYQAIQVTTSLDNPQVKEREIGGLLEAMIEHHLIEGVILTENEEEQLTIPLEGNTVHIAIMPIWKWLLF